MAGGKLHGGWEWTLVSCALPWCSGLLCGVIAWLERAPSLESKIRSPVWVDWFGPIMRFLARVG